jgi:hypothetical protein
MMGYFPEVLEVGPVISHAKPVLWQLAAGPNRFSGNYTKYVD